MTAVTFTWNFRLRSIILVGLVLAMAGSRVQIVQGQVPLPPFAGQQSVYEWTSVGNSTEWFSNHEAVTRITATITHTVVTLNAENFSVIVQVSGRVDWPTDSINRSVYLATVEWISILELNYTWTRLETNGTFTYSYSAILDYLGRIQALDGPTDLKTECTLPGDSYHQEESLTQDWPDTRTLYFCHDLTVAVDDIVGVWRDTNAHVMRREPRTTAVGVRPTVEMGRFFSDRFWDISLESWVDYTQNSTFVYDVETGFLLDFRVQAANLLNENCMTSTHHAQLLQTNMYLPRWNQLFPFVMLGTVMVIFGVVLIVIAFRFYRSY